MATEIAVAPAPIKLRRWLYLAGLALLGLTVFRAFAPVVQGSASENQPEAVFLGVLLALGSLAALVLLAARKPEANDSLVFPVLAGILLFVIQSTISFLLGSRFRFLPFLIPRFITGIAEPLLWGAAWGVLENPRASRIQRLARIDSGIILVAFLWSSSLEAIGMIVRFRMNGPNLHSEGWGPVLSMLSLLSRGLLFWACVEVLRSAEDAAVVRSRAQKIGKLIHGRVAAGLLLAGVRFGVVRDFNGVQTLWSSIVYFAVVAAVALVLLRYFRRAAC